MPSTTNQADFEPRSLVLREDVTAARRFSLTASDRRTTDCGNATGDMPQQLRAFSLLPRLSASSCRARSRLGETVDFAGVSSKPTPGLEPGTPSLRVKCSTS